MCTIKGKSTCGEEKDLYKSIKSGERIFVDTSGPFPESLIENWHLIGLVDDYSRYSWSVFAKTNSKIAKKTEEFFEKMT